MSDPNTMGTSPTDQWLQFYDHNLVGQTRPASITTSSMGATVVSTTTTASNPGMNTMDYGSTSASNQNPNPDGRVARPARRRSRASRRTPTTLLNTDTTNFRAMVQQYTGGPSASFPSSGFTIGGAPNFNIGHGARLQQHQNMMSNQIGITAPAGGGASSYNREGDHQGSFRLQFQQPAQYTFQRPNVMDLTSDEQIGMEGLGSAYGAAPAHPPGDSSSSENKSRNNFFF